MPVNFIQTFSVQHIGKRLVEGQLNTSVAKNPLFVFKTRSIKAGDRLVVAWKDNLGEQRQDEITVA